MTSSPLGQRRGSQRSHQQAQGAFAALQNVTMSHAASQFTEWLQSTRVRKYFCAANIAQWTSHNNSLLSICSSTISAPAGCEPSTQRLRMTFCWVSAISWIPARRAASALAAVTSSHDNLTCVYLAHDELDSVTIIGIIIIVIVIVIAIIIIYRQYFYYLLLMFFII